VLPLGFSFWFGVTRKCRRFDFIFVFVLSRRTVKMNTREGHHRWNSWLGYEIKPISKVDRMGRLPLLIRRKMMSMY
jgi:hypothetical protein